MTPSASLTGYVLKPTRTSSLRTCDGLKVRITFEKGTVSSAKCEHPPGLFCCPTISSKGIVDKTCHVD
jgi:hypothetical protein